MFSQKCAAAVAVGVEHEIDTGSEKPVKNVAPGRRPPRDRKLVSDMTKEMVENGVCEVSHSPWSSPVTNMDFPFVVQTDACDDGLGAVLSQVVDNIERVIALECCNRQKRYGRCSKKKRLQLSTHVKHFDRICTVLNLLSRQITSR